MDKNLLLAVTLSIAVYALWFGVIEKRYVKTAPATAPTAVSAAQRQAAAPAPMAPAVQKAEPAAATEPTPDRKAIESEAELIATPQADLRVHPQGAAIVSCLYREPLGSVELVHDAKHGLFATWPQLRFQKEPGAAPVYSTARPDGMKIIKEFLPGGQNSLPRLRIRLVNPTRQTLETGAWTMSMGPGLDTVASEKKENPSVWRAIGLPAAAPSKCEVLKPGEHGAPYLWVGVDNRYFLAAVAPPAGEFTRVDSSMPPQVTLTAKNDSIPPGGEKVWDIPYYLGAKAYTQLGRYHIGLEKSVDFGFFRDLGRPILRLLGWLQSITKNWGWAIVLMTFFIQALLLPLTFKSMKAMAAMKKLQPELARLQQKYAKDTSRLSAETMELYKKSGANPLGGCLPLMLQMPVFIALFNTLRNAWELHGAPWIFWVRDLAAHDPYYILPIVMGGVMFLQNRMNPATTSDPTQKSMMTWMPVIFTFMFLKTPAGLVLYWLTSSIINYALQMALKEHFERA